MGILFGTTLRIGESRLLQDFSDAGIHLGTRDHVVGLEGLLDLGTDLPHRVQVGHGVLGYQSDL